MKSSKPMAITDKEFRELREFIHAHTGISLSDHKRALVCARLAKRLRHHSLTRYNDYYKLLTENDPDGDELSAMINSITTNKTDFFREVHHFQFLTKQFLLQFKQAALHTGNRKLRIWSSASSTGEEPYSIAMTVLEIFPYISDWDIKILATDIDTDVLKKAKEGVYTEKQAEKIPDNYLRRYFYKGKGDGAGHVMAKPILKNIIHFDQLNLLEEPWPMKGMFDIIFCRNVVIYFNKDTQKKLFARMRDIIKPDGYLMLGHSESLHGMDSGFYPVGHSIYRRLDKPGNLNNMEPKALDSAHPS